MAHDTALDYVAARVEITDDCWLWRNRPNSNGYAYAYVQGKQYRAHRYVYEALVGPIPEGHDLDHLCHNEADPPCLLGSACPHRVCVNPDHLEPVSPIENVRRVPYWANAHKTQCVNGHPFDEANTFVSKRNGWRSCRACGRDWKRRKEAMR